jgi:molybdopterin-containing oxidoreductase family iron-sulfur binding subunit
VARRTFLKLMGASIALAGIGACTRQPAEKIVPYVRQPEDLVPGQPLFFATAMALGGVATGLLVESHEGRPTKIEGNPAHPGSLGASDVFAQAAILGLYDPDRSQTLTNLGEIRPWIDFLATIRNMAAAQRPLAGAGLRILTESVGSPTLSSQLRSLLQQFPSAKWHQWDSLGENVWRGPAFGRSVDALPRRRAEAIGRPSQLPWRRPGIPPLRARLRRAAKSGAHEPALCVRERADHHGVTRGSSSGTQAE